MVNLVFRTLTAIKEKLFGNFSEQSAAFDTCLLVDDVNIFNRVDFRSSQNNGMVDVF